MKSNSSKWEISLLEACNPPPLSNSPNWTKCAHVHFHDMAPTYTGHSRWPKMENLLSEFYAGKFVFWLSSVSQKFPPCLWPLHFVVGLVDQVKPKLGSLLVEIIFKHVYSLSNICPATWHSLLSNILLLLAVMLSFD